MSARGEQRGGGLASWSIRHPVGVSMIALGVMVLGLFTFDRLPVDLLPHIIYPEVRVRVLDPGVPATVMEDQVTRQLEEQLAITEDAISIQSSSSEGSTQVDLAFAYGVDIDKALRDASTRLDRAKRFLPDTIDPPIIYKRDPSQIPVAEYVISSSGRDAVNLRDWVDYDFANQFLNLPGVAAVEVGGGLIREIQVLPDQHRLAALGLTLDKIAATIRASNIEKAAGRVTMQRQELNSRTTARVESVGELRRLPIRLADGSTVPLGELAEVRDTHADQRIKVRLNGDSGVKVSIQKQPSSNTVSVVDAVNERLAWMKNQHMVPGDITIRSVSDQSVYVRNALNNASLAALSGTLLAMLVVYLFLGSLRRTLIIGSAIPIAILVTFVFMGLGDLTFNIMTLGGLALGIGMLVDNTIVMLENVHRHQRRGEEPLVAGTEAAREINGAIVASTSTNLSAVIPFLFVGGLTGLLFRELIFTISAAILASMIVALTLVPAYAVKVIDRGRNPMRELSDRLMERLQNGYSRLVRGVVTHPLIEIVLVASLGAALYFSYPVFEGKQEFLPRMDNGEVTINITADAGVSLAEMDKSVRRIETMLREQPEVATVFSIVGGFIFGRTEREAPNKTYMTVLLVPREQRSESSDDWVKRMQKEVGKLKLIGMRVRAHTRGIRGIRIGSGDDDISLRIQGDDPDMLYNLAESTVSLLQGTPGIRNLSHSSEEVDQELRIRIDRQRAADLGLNPAAIAEGVRFALNGAVIGDYLEGDRSFDILMRLPREEVATPADLSQILLYPDRGGSLPLSEVAEVGLDAAPAQIRRDNQRRIVEISASLTGDLPLSAVIAEVDQRLEDLELPTGYSLYDGGASEALNKGKQTGTMLISLAVFLVFVVMAVQYESLRNPAVIILSVPFAAIGVAVALLVTGISLSMPVWLGMIMLTGIVVNNAIILVEYIEIARDRGMVMVEAIGEAARLRLRPILMTTLTTVFGMLPLALGWGEGAEMLQPLAISLIGGLLSALPVSLFVIPTIYRLSHRTGGAR